MWIVNTIIFHMADIFSFGNDQWSRPNMDIYRHRRYFTTIFSHFPSKSLVLQKRPQLSTVGCIAGWCTGNILASLSPPL